MASLCVMRYYVGISFRDAERIQIRKKANAKKLLFFRYVYLNFYASRLFFYVCA